MAEEQVLQGQAVVHGVGIGVLLRYAGSPVASYAPTAVDSAAEEERLHVGLTQASTEIAALAAEARTTLGGAEAGIFEAQQLMAEDPELIDGALELIRSQAASAEAAILTTAQAVSAMLASLDDPYLRERSADVLDVARRVVRILQGAPHPLDLSRLSAPTILLAPDLSPSETAGLRNVVGIGLLEGGPTSHAAILARARAIPLVVGLREWPQTGDGATVVLDGTTGRLLLNPAPATLAHYQQQAASEQQATAQLASLRDLPAITSDGYRLRLVGNATSLADAEAIAAEGGEGIGLLRTEFLFGERELTEAEQTAAYAAILAALPGREIVIRTLDLGGDKPPAWLAFPTEANPFLGWRGLRVGLDRPALLASQLRAILKAADRKLSIMFPMVTTVEELRAARKLVAEAQAATGVAEVEVGIMVEVPAAVLMADLLAREADFFSIGTNDLTQYVLAADRSNPHVASLYSAKQPALLRAVARVVEAAHAEGRWVGICGEAAGDPQLTPLWLGLGVDELSMAAPSLLPVKAVVRASSAARCRELAAAALRAATLAEVESLLG